MAKKSNNDDVGPSGEIRVDALSLRLSLRITPVDYIDFAIRILAFGSLDTYTKTIYPDRFGNHRLQYLARSWSSSVRLESVNLGEKERTLNNKYPCQHG
jgi:hypothetical protein